jgi:hypothetical protein
MWPVSVRVPAPTEWVQACRPNSGHSLTAVRWAGERGNRIVLTVAVCASDRRAKRFVEAHCGQEYADSCPQPVEMGQRAIPAPAYEAGVATGPEA